MTDTERDLTHDELDRERAAALPDREALSLISGDLTQTDAALPIEGGESYGAVDQAQGAGGQAGGASADAAADAQEAASGDASGSTSGGESVTSEDRSESITASDSATATS